MAPDCRLMRSAEGSSDLPKLQSFSSESQNWLDDSKSFVPSSYLRTCHLYASSDTLQPDRYSSSSINFTDDTSSSFLKLSIKTSHDHPSQHQTTSTNRSEIKSHLCVYRNSKFKNVCSCTKKSNEEKIIWMFHKTMYIISSSIVCLYFLLMNIAIILKETIILCGWKSCENTSTYSKSMRSYWSELTQRMLDFNIFSRSLDFDSAYRRRLAVVRGNSSPSSAPSSPSRDCRIAISKNYSLRRRYRKLISAITRSWKSGKLVRWTFVQLVLLLACLPRDVSGGQHERRLLSDLLGNYNPLERPVANESNPVEVKFGITLQQIMDVDEKNQLLITNTWLRLEWNDVNLHWNESDYGNVKDLRVPTYKLWKPDVLMYNSADEGFDGTYQTKVVVYSNGNCLYIPPGIFKSTCKIDITWFPFDDQNCKMKFGSWTYSGWQLDLKLQSEEGGDLSDFTKNGEWDLIGCPGKRNTIFYQCCPEPYVDITFEIKIRRRTLYYFCNLILPCVLIASMAVLGFTLPPDCGEKLSLGVTILLSLTVFSNMVNDTMPTTSDAVPLLGTYFNCIMFMVASSVVSTVLILNYHHRSADTHQMTPLVRSMFLQWLPYVLRMHRPGEKITRKTIKRNREMKELELPERSSKSLLANVLDINDDFRSNTLPHAGHGANNSTVAGGIIRIPHSGHSIDDSQMVHTCMSQCSRELNLILKEIRMITDKMRKEDEELEVANDWRFAAMVVDRMCLIVFTLFTVVATVAVLLSAPHVMVS